jgi:hypothetical protein
MPAAIDAAPAGDAERHLLDALTQRYGADPFSARDAAAAIPSTLWSAAGVARPDAGSVGRWLRAHRSASLTGKPDRSGIVRWRLRAAAVPVAALQAPAPAPHTRQRRRRPRRRPGAPPRLQHPRRRLTLRRRPRSLRRPGGIRPPRRPTATSLPRAGHAGHGGRLRHGRRHERPPGIFYRQQCARERSRGGGRPLNFDTSTHAGVPPREVRQKPAPRPDPLGELRTDLAAVLAVLEASPVPRWGASGRTGSRTRWRLPGARSGGRWRPRGRELEFKSTGNQTGRRRVATAYSGGTTPR